MAAVSLQQFTTLFSLLSARAGQSKWNMCKCSVQNNAPIKPRSVFAVGYHWIGWATHAEWCTVVNSLENCLILHSEMWHLAHSLNCFHWINEQRHDFSASQKRVRRSTKPVFMNTAHIHLEVSDTASNAPFFLLAHKNLVIPNNIEKCVLHVRNDKSFLDRVD